MDSLAPKRISKQHANQKAREFRIGMASDFKVTRQQQFLVRVLIQLLDLESDRIGFKGID